MKTLKFARNYNDKLDNPIFTTIRDYHDYDEMLMRDMVEVEHDEKSFKAEVLSIEPYVELKKVPNHTLFQDTGCTNFGEVTELFGSFGIGAADPVLVITLERMDQ